MYQQRLIALARGHLDAKIRPKVDPEDVMQSVFKSFFLRFAAERFSLEDWDSLWSLLTVMTLRRCGFRTRYFHADCRDVRREALSGSGDGSAEACWEAIAREPSPPEAAMLVEVMEQTFRGLDARDRLIIELSLQGYSVAEISMRADRAERTIHRTLERVKGKLERMSTEDGARA
jgi:RNA polymerase sigma-70 factor (ECF subfamily)